MGKKYVSEFKVAILKFRDVCKIQMLHCTPTWAELKLPTPSAYNTHRFCSIVAKGVWNFCDFLETQCFPTHHIDLYLIWMANKWGTLKILSLIIFILDPDSDPNHKHRVDPMPEGFQPTVTMPRVPGQFQAEKSRLWMQSLSGLLHFNHHHQYYHHHIHLFRFPSGRKAAGSSRCNWLSERLST